MNDAAAISYLQIKNLGFFCYVAKERSQSFMQI